MRRARPRFAGACAAPALLVGCVLAACGGSGATAPVAVEVSDTVAIGGLPGPFSDTTLPEPTPTTAISTTTTEVPVPVVVPPIVDDVDEHRVLLVGDTALAATTPRFGGIMCDVVAGFGWDVAVEAEPGRFIAFADGVFDERLDAGWDVAGLMFGHHVATTTADFERSLAALLDRLEPRPILLYTVAETGAEQIGVNRVIGEQAAQRPNVIVIDWASAAGDEPDLLLDDGGPTPTDEGAGRLALFTVAALGEIPDADPGECIDPVFTDDSAIVL